MLAVGFNEQRVFLLHGGVDEQVAKFGLKGWVKVEFWLLDA